MKLPYSLREKEKDDILKMKELRDKLFKKEISIEEFEKEMDNLANRQLKLI